MATYADGFLIPVPRKNLESYIEMAHKACALWMEHGALDYKETVLDDAENPMGQPFTKGVACKEDEAVILAWITYPSREQRDAINKRVMDDPRMKEMCPGEGSEMPFDCSRMLYGGFTVRVDSARLKQVPQSV